MNTALAWVIFVGLPWFTLHMLIVDYEHSLQGMSLQFSFAMTLKIMIPWHPVSIGLWLSAVFLTAFSLCRAFRRQKEILVMRGMLRSSQIEAEIDELTSVSCLRVAKSLRITGYSARGAEWFERDQWVIPPFKT